MLAMYSQFSNLQPFSEYDSPFDRLSCWYRLVARKSLCNRFYQFHEKLFTNDSGRIWALKYFFSFFVILATSTRWVQMKLSFSMHVLVVDKSRGDIKNYFFLETPWPRIEPGPAGWEAWTLPLCYAAPQHWKIFTVFLKQIGVSTYTLGLTMSACWHLKNVRTTLFSYIRASYWPHLLLEKILDHFF